MSEDFVILNPRNLHIDRGAARSQMRILQNELEISGLPSGSRNVIIGGVLYSCELNYGIGKVHCTAVNGQATNVHGANALTPEQLKGRLQAFALFKVKTPLALGAKHAPKLAWFFIDGDPLATRATGFWGAAQNAQALGRLVYEPPQGYIFPAIGTYKVKMSWVPYDLSKYTPVTQIGVVEVLTSVPADVIPIRVRGGGVIGYTPLNFSGFVINGQVPQITGFVFSGAIEEKTNLVAGGSVAKISGGIVTSGKAVTASGIVAAGKVPSAPPGGGVISGTASVIKTSAPSGFVIGGNAGTPYIRIGQGGFCVGGAVTAKPSGFVAGQLTVPKFSGAVAGGGILGPPVTEDLIVEDWIPHLLDTKVFFPNILSANGGTLSFSVVRCSYGAAYATSTGIKWVNDFSTDVVGANYITFKVLETVGNIKLESAEKQIKFVIAPAIKPPTFMRTSQYSGYINGGYRTLTKSLYGTVYHTAVNIEARSQDGYNRTVTLGQLDNLDNSWYYVPEAGITVKFTTQISTLTLDIPFSLAFGPPKKLTAYLTIAMSMSGGTFIEVSQTKSISIYPDSRGGTVTVWSGSSSIVSITAINGVWKAKGLKLGSTAIYMTQKGAGGFQDTTTSIYVTVTNSSYLLMWSDLYAAQSNVPQPVGWTEYSSSGYTSHSIPYYTVNSYDGNWRVIIISELGYEGLTVELGFETKPSGSNPFVDIPLSAGPPGAVSKINDNWVQGLKLRSNFEGGGSGPWTYFMDTEIPDDNAYYYILYVYKRS